MIESARDIDFMLREAGVPVSCGRASTCGIFDQSDDVTPTEDGLGFEVLGTTIVIRTGTLGRDLKVDALITVTINGTSTKYAVRDIRVQGDGQLQRVKLADVT